MKFLTALSLLSAVLIMVSNTVSLGAVSAESTAQKTAVDAKIEIVWPHDQLGRPAPVDKAESVNIEVYLFERGTLNPVACDFPNEVTLHRGTNPVPGPFATEPSPAQAWKTGQRIMREKDGKPFPVWVFNDIPAGIWGGTDGPASIKYSYTFFVSVADADARTNVWVHAEDPRTYLPGAVPRRVGTEPPTAVDTYIAIVWPHDRQGMVRPVDQASLVNIGADIIGQESIGRRVFSVQPTFDRPVRLWRALNNGFLEPMATGTPMMTTAVDSGFTYTWPRWVFNDVDVAAAQNPQNKYYFAVFVDGMETNPTIWVHGADGRTILPQPDVPSRSCRS
jgi:hypothetical protein